METEGRLRLADVFVSIDDPRQAWKVEHDLVELLVVAVNAVLVGADTFVEIELWAREKLDWLRGHLRLENGIPSHDTTWAHQVVAKEAYAPFGEAYDEAGAPDRSFTGQDQDTVTGVFDYLFRRYDPVAGRWLSPDPLGWGAVSKDNPQSLNRYAYVMNDPMSLTDPDGLCTTYAAPDNTSGPAPCAPPVAPINPYVPDASFGGTAPNPTLPTPNFTSTYTTEVTAPDGTTVDITNTEYDASSGGPIVGSLNNGTVGAGYQPFDPAANQIPASYLAEVGDGTWSNSGTIQADWTFTPYPQPVLPEFPVTAPPPSQPVVPVCRPHLIKMKTASGVAVWVTLQCSSYNSFP